MRDSVGKLWNALKNVYFGMKKKKKKIFFVNFFFFTGNSKVPFLIELQHSEWFDHIKILLEGTRKIVGVIDGGSPVFLHCSDGWDR